MDGEATDRALERLLDQATDEVRCDPELSEAVRQQTSMQLDGLVDRIRAVLAIVGLPPRPGTSGRSDGLTDE